MKKFIKLKIILIIIILIISLFDFPDKIRNVKATLTESEFIYDKEIGCIKSIYNIDGKIYIDVDLVEFYLGNKIALREALKDNIDLPVKENGYPYVPDGYYIRNTSNQITTYEISNNCSFQLLNHDFSALGYDTIPISNSSIPELASFDDFKTYINLRVPINIECIVNKSITERETLCWIELKNNVVYSIYRQYTP